MFTMAVNSYSILPYLLQWVMIYSFGINTVLGNRSQFDSLSCNILFLHYLYSWLLEEHELDKMMNRKMVVFFSEFTGLGCSVGTHLNFRNECSSDDHSDGFTATGECSSISSYTVKPK